MLLDAFFYASTHDSVRAGLKFFERGLTLESLLYAEKQGRDLYVAKFTTDNRTKVVTARE